MMMRLISLYWLVFAAFEAFYRNSAENANTGVIIASIFWVGAEIIKAIRRREDVVG